MTDRRYGVNQYGDGKLYGPSDARESLLWEISIDWNDDGFFDGNESSRLTYVKISRGRSQLLDQVGEGFQAVQDGSAIIHLRNDDGRFDGWNTGSALFPNVNYGKDVRMRVKDMETGIIYPMFRGLITDIVPMGYGSAAKVAIHVSDGLMLLRNIVARVATQTGITPSAAIGMTLDAVSWPASLGRDLDADVETIPYWWASGNRQAMSEIQDLANSFLGYFFCDASGRARYVARTSVSAAVANYAQEYLLKDIENPQPFALQRNITRLKVHPRTQAATGVIWELVGTVPSVNPGAANAVALFANYSYNSQPVPAMNVITPVATTDFLVNTQSDGGGTDLTSSCTVALDDFGDTALLTIVNNSGSLGYVTFLRVRGDAIYEQDASDVTYPTDLTTVRAPRELFLDLAWQQNINVAIDIAGVLGPFYDARHPMPRVRIENRPALQFAADLFDVVTVDLDFIGLSGESYRVGYIEHETIMSENCQSVRTSLSLEPYVSAENFMIWDDASEWDTETVFGY